MVITYFANTAILRWCLVYIDLKVQQDTFLFGFVCILICYAKIIKPSDTESNLKQATTGHLNIVGIGKHKTSQVYSPNNQFYVYFKYRITGLPMLCFSKV